MPLIARETAFQVTANDFFGINAAHCSLCDEARAEAQVAACTSVDCPLRVKDAA